MRRVTGVDFVPHDLRRTVATFLTSELGVSRLVVSKLLNHAETGVTRVYDRASYDREKWQALEAWGDELERLVRSQRPGREVVPLESGVSTAVRDKGGAMGLQEGWPFGRTRIAIVALILIPLGTFDARAAGNPIGNEFRANSQTTGNEIQPAVAKGPDGGFVVVWQGADRAYGQRYEGDGSPAGSEFMVSPLRIDGGPQVAVATDGGFVVVWADASGQDGDSSGILARRYDDGGAPLGAPFQVNTVTTGLQRRPALAMAATGRFVVVWTDYSGQDGSGKSIQGQRYDRTGQALGGEFQVNTVTTGGQSNPRVAMDADGFVVVWTDEVGQDGSGSSIQGQRYDGNGTSIGGEFQVNTVTTDAQTSPDVAVNANGEFVVVWIDENDFYGDRSIRGQRFSGVSRVGDEFNVGAATTYTDNRPRVALHSTGAFVVTWTDDTASYGVPRNLDIRGRCYKSNGQPLESDFLVNTYTTNSQTSSALALGADGDFVVAWASRTQDGEQWGVFGQRFEGPSIGVEAKRLVILDKLALAGRGRVVYVSKDGAAGVGKGAGTDAADISATFDFRYGATEGKLRLPVGAFTATEGWKANSPTVAKYVNKSAPRGGTVTSLAVIKPGKLLKVVAKGLGDPPNEAGIMDAGPPSGEVSTAFAIDNAGNVSVFCSVFSECVYKVIAAGTGSKLVCKNGVPDLDCAAVGSQ